MDYKQIQDLIKLVNKNKIAELKLEQDDFKIVIRSQDGATSVSENNAPTQLVTMMPSHTPIAQAAAVAVPAAAAAPVAASAPAPATSSPEAENASGLIEVKSPMIGTFYRAPGPDKDPFVSIGAKVEIGDTICMIEAMKLFNDIEAELSGKVVKILVEDATPVEFDQPLFLIDPNA